MPKCDFINTGQTLQDRKLIQNLELENETREVFPLGIKMPIEKGSESYETLFKMNTDLNSQISNNFKTFVLTRKGEVLCQPDFGTNIFDIYNRTDLELEDIENIVMNELTKGVQKFFPFINLIDFSSDELKNKDTNLENYIKISIRYSLVNNNSKVNNLEIKVRRSI